MINSGANGHLPRINEGNTNVNMDDQELTDRNAQFINENNQEMTDGFSNYYNSWHHPLKGI